MCRVKKSLYRRFTSHETRSPSATYEHRSTYAVYSFPSVSNDETPRVADTNRPSRLPDTASGCMYAAEPPLPLPEHRRNFLQYNITTRQKSRACPESSLPALTHLPLSMCIIAYTPTCPTASNCGSNLHQTFLKKHEFETTCVHDHENFKNFKPILQPALFKKRDTCES